MGLADPFRVVYYERRDSWIIKRGSETFYDDDRCMLEFENPTDAAAYAAVHLGARSVSIETKGGKDGEI